MFDNEFFPTPYAVVHKMLEKVSRDARHFLEPSAGKGNIADVIANQSRYRQGKVDCIEQSPELAMILSGKGFPVVGYDWLEYAGVCYYDAIIMNPPFSNGDEHLLKAWDFLHSGEIVCLLNDETLKNPYSANRKRLSAVIEAHGSVEYLGDCFSTAERKTGVNVAMVYLKKVAEDDTIDLWATDTQERDIRDDIDEGNMLAIVDKLANMQHYYDEANNHMLKAFQHIRKAGLYMVANGVKGDYKDIVAMAFGNVQTARAEYLQKHRNEAWKSVFEQMDFRKWLDSKQRDEFIRDIERNGNIPFTKENIKGTLQNVFAERSRLFEKSVANVFDALTRYYNGNTNHKEGWKSNDGYKVNEKLVFPYGCTYDKGFMGFSLYYGRGDVVYDDLDRVLCVMSGKDFAKCKTVSLALRDAFQTYRQTGEKTTESDFFQIAFFQKGTVHLKFKDRALMQEFNKTAAKGKAWLGRDTQTGAAA